MKKAFSLVELSIVLVILGLLTGGILAGQSLIRAAEVRSVSADLQRYYTATQTFRDKYMAAPGDMRNAVRFWGAQTGAVTDGYDSDCAALTTISTGTATCNGNGDGQIGPVAAHLYERFRLWQHLANAGLIEGSYTGVSASGGATAENATAGLNVPRSKISNVGFYIGYWGVNTNNSDGWFNGDYKGNCIMMGVANNSYASGAFLKPEELWNLDVKMDDGKPATGNLIVTSTSYAACMNNVSETNTSGVEYQLTNNAIVCSLIFRPGI